MKDFNRLEKHLNDLASKQEKNPPAFVWDQIDDKLPKKKKKKKSRFFWFLLLGFLITVTAGYLWINTDTNSLNSDVPTISNDSNLQLVAVEKSVKTNELKEASLDVSKEQGANVPEVKESLINKNQAVIDDKEGNVISKFNDVTSSKVIQKTNEIESRFKEKSLNNTISETYNSPGKETFSNSSDQIVLQNPTIGQTIKSINRSSSDKEEKINDGKVTLLEIDALASSLMLLPSTVENLDLDLMIQKPLIQESLDENIERTLFIDFGVLGGIHNTNLTESDSSAMFRKSTESNWYTWGLSTQVGLQLNKNVYLKSGIEYINSRDKFDFERSNVKLEETPDSSENQFRISRANYYNIGDITYQQFNIPLTIGGEVTKGKYRMGMELTSLFNVKFLTEGKIRTGDLVFSRVQDEQTYKSSLGLGVRAAFTVGMDLSDKSSLYVKPTWSKYIGNTNREGNRVSSNLAQYYLELSLRRRF